jgi:hypothetical protein
MGRQDAAREEQKRRLRITSPTEPKLRSFPMKRMIYSTLAMALFRYLTRLGQTRKAAPAHAAARRKAPAKASARAAKR